MNRFSTCLLAALLLCPSLAWSQTPVEIRDPTTNQSISPATAAGQTAANTSLATIAGAQGTGGTGITQPTGGTGVQGWLSGIYKAVTGSLTVRAGGLTYTISGGNTYGSGQATIYTAGTATQVFSISSISTNTGSCWVSLTGGTAAANSGQEIVAGGGFSWGGTSAPLPTGNNLTVTCPTSQTLTYWGG